MRRMMKGMTATALLQELPQEDVLLVGGPLL
jgi:hypothetical protein